MSWYLKKAEGGTVFGPVTFDQIKDWANSAQISPLDKISNDGESWVKAPQFAELEMDWLIEPAPDQLYGPTTIYAIREFLRIGEVSPECTVINSREATTHKLSEVREVFIDAELGVPSEPKRTGIKDHLQARVRQLEHLIMEERKLRMEAEIKLRRLEEKVDSGKDI